MRKISQKKYYPKNGVIINDNGSEIKAKNTLTHTRTDSGVWIVIKITAVDNK